MPYEGYTQARNKATQKYQKEHLEQMNLRFPKGYRAKLQEHLDMTGECTIEFVRRAIAETIERDREKMRGAFKKED